MPPSFVFQASPSRIVFGAGSLAHVRREVEALGATRALVLSTPEQLDSARRVAELLGDRAAGIFAEGRDARADRDRARGARRWRAGWVPTAPSRSAAARPPAWARRSRWTAGCRSWPIPTTYAGSEMTPIYGLTEGGVKKTGRDRAGAAPHRDLRPRADADAAAGDDGDQRAERDRPRVPRACTRTTATRSSALMAEEGIRASAAALPPLQADPRDLRGTQRCAVRRLAVRHRARQRVDGPAPQAVPHAGRQLQPAACRDAHRGPAARAGLQRRAGATGDGAHRCGAGRARRGARRVPTSRGGWAPRPRSRRSACPWTAWTAPPTWPSRTRIRTLGRWSARP